MALRPADISAIKLNFFGNVGKEYELDDLLRAEADVLGKGTFGTSYRAELENEKTLAVKRLWTKNASEKEFQEKVEELGKMVHENLLPIKAYSCIKDESILVYDYMPMGSLAVLLHGDGGGFKTPLSWDMRCSVVYGVACGIAYIHSKGSKFCHGNIRSSNVFVSNFFDVHLSEFGIWQLVSTESKTKLIEGYRAPEVTNPQQVSQKSDVYSFGVLLLELLTGKAPLGVLRTTSGVDLPKWVRSMFQERPIIEVFDHELLKEQNIGNKMVQLLQLAICCTFENPGKRPSIAAVTNRIKQIWKLT